MSLENIKMKKPITGERSKRAFLSNLIVNSGDTKPDKDLVYMKRIDDPLKRLIEWYFDEGKTILDVTAGERRIWKSSFIHGTNLISGEKSWNVVFLDQSMDADADIVADFRRIPLPDNSVDVIVFDPPFIKASNGIEGFGIKTHKTPDREFYFRQSDQWIPPEAFFFQTWREFNRVSRNGLIVKISDRFENGYEIPVRTYMDLAYNNIFNKKSKFKKCLDMGYRGKRAGMGAKMIHPQRVLTNYIVYKKDRKIR